MKKRIEIQYRDEILRLEVLVRPAGRECIVYLHGLGTSKEDFEPFLRQSLCQDFSVYAFDFPGCGRSAYPQHSHLAIEDLVVVLEKALDKLDVTSCHLIGHSMGGLTGLKYANRFPDKVKSFTNIEGNLAPVDCRVFSRFVADQAYKANEEQIFSKLDSEMTKKCHPEYEFFRKNLKKRVTFSALTSYCQSIVDTCDSVDLLSVFVNLDCPRMFIYGEENRDLPYLELFRENKIEVREIKGSDHFPFISNPEQLFSVIGNFIIPDTQNTTASL